MQAIVTLAMNPAIDKSSSIDHVVPERKLRCDPPRHEPGGGGINVARAIKRLGAEATAIYPAGGLTGRMLQGLLDQEGIRHQAVLIEGCLRENLSVSERSTGQQFRFVMPGPTLSEVEWQRCLDELAAVSPKPAYIVASGSLPPGVPVDFYARVAHLAKRFGSRAIVDTSGEALCLSAEEGVYLLKPNLREFQQLTRCMDIMDIVEDESQQEAAAMQVVEKRQSEVVILSLGAAGVLLASSEGHDRIRSPIVPIRSKVGAGDSTVAGIVLSLARGKSLREAVLFGVACGAASVMNSCTELCRREDSERLYRQMASRAASGSPNS